VVTNEPSLHQVPILSIERINDLESEHFRDSPGRKYDVEHDYLEVGNNRVNFVSADEADTDSPTGSSDPEKEYKKTSVADESLRDLPTSPKDPPGYRVY